LDTPDRSNDLKTANTIDEIRKDHGLPTGIRTEAQLWDEILKKEVYKEPALILSLIREVFGVSYPDGTPITPIATEFSVEAPDSKIISSIRSDITMKVGSADIYHFECEISTDPDMDQRMYDYDSQIALTYPRKQNGKPVELVYPYSAVLFLKPGVRIADHLVCKVYFPACRPEQQAEGEKKVELSCMDYIVFSVKVQKYTLQQIREKRLLLLIPFTPIRFRAMLRKEKYSVEFAKIKLTEFFREIIMILDEAVSEGFLSENGRKMILTLLRKAMIRVFCRSELIEEVVHMTAPILELEWETIERLEKENAALAAKMEEKEAAAAKMEEEKEAMVAKMEEEKEEMAAKIVAEKDAIIAEKEAEIRALRKKRRWLFYRGRTR